MEYLDEFDPETGGFLLTEQLAPAIEQFLSTIDIFYPGEPRSAEYEMLVPRFPLYECFEPAHEIFYVPRFAGPLGPQPLERLIQPVSRDKAVDLEELAPPAGVIGPFVPFDPFQHPFPDAALDFEGLAVGREGLARLPLAGLESRIGDQEGSLVAMHLQIARYDIVELVRIDLVVREHPDHRLEGLFRVPRLRRQSGEESVRSEMIGIPVQHLEEDLEGPFGRSPVDR